MPLFEFTCRHCGTRFEALILGGRRAECPHCGSDDLEKHFSTFGSRTSGAADRGPAASRFT
jgi:putative FmdB family regulatory protein